MGKPPVTTTTTVAVAVAAVAAAAAAAAAAHATRRMIYIFPLVSPFFLPFLVCHSID